MATAGMVVLATAGAWWWVRTANWEERRPAGATVDIPYGLGAPEPESPTASAPGPVAIVPSPYREAAAETSTGSKPTEGSLRVRAHWSDGTAAAGVIVTFHLRGAARAATHEEMTDSTGLTPPIAAQPQSATASLDRCLRHWRVDIIAGREGIRPCFRLTFLDDSRARSDLLLDSPDQAGSTAAVPGAGPAEP